jgi:hypothetical protein
MGFDKKLSGCFGSDDLKFAGHPADEDRAFQWLASLRRRKIGCKAALKQIREFLQSKGATAGHTKTQTVKAARYLKPWLLD